MQMRIISHAPIITYNPLQVNMATFSRWSSWPDGIIEVERMAAIRCAAKCLSVPSCKAFTYDEDDQLCILPNTLMEMGQFASTREPHAKYVQMVSLTNEQMGSFIHTNMQTHHF